MEPPSVGCVEVIDDYDYVLVLPKIYCFIRETYSAIYQRFQVKMIVFYRLRPPSVIIVRRKICSHHCIIYRP